MPVPLRQVRRLRLKCERDEHARHGQILLEDALRTASLHDEDRLIIVKRLNLGILPARASATTWSRRLEESVRSQGPQQITFDKLADERAPVVSFSSALEPWLILARNLLEGRRCTEWYWRSALPGWTPSMPTPDALRLCFQTLAAQGSLRATLLLVRHLKTTDALLTLLRTLTETDLAPLKADLIDTASSTSSTPTDPATLSLLVLPTLSSAEKTFLHSAGPNALRSAWLAAARLSLNQSPSSFSLASCPSPARIEQVLHHWQESTAPTSPTRPPESLSVITQPESPAPSNTSLQDTPNKDTNPTSQPPKPQAPDADSLPERAFTQAGGLFFLIPLLQRAGLPAALATLPDEERNAFPWQILKTALLHTRIDEADPLAIVLSDLPATTHPVGPWLIRANRLALLLTGANLRKIIRRPALATISPTQIDLFFRASEADLRFRRCGLDLDPGWLPWLQRTVRYHFNRED